MVEVITRPDGGGAEFLVRELTTKLPAHNIDVYTLYLNNPSKVLLGPHEESLNVKSYRGLSAFFCLLKRLRELKKDNNNLLVHAHLIWPLYHAAFVSVFVRAIYIYTEHSTYNRRRNWSLLRPLERWVYGKYASVVCISEGVRRALSEWLLNNILERNLVTIKNGARMLPIGMREPIEGRPLRLISIGALQHRKGFDVALQAIAVLGDCIAEYVVLGEGPERERLKAMADSLGIGHKVRMPGFCKDILPYLHGSDLGIIPSRWEGFGLVSIEALSTGLPLVASDVAGLNEVLADCPAAVLCRPDDSSALVRGVEEARNRLVGRSEMVDAARKHAERFNIEKMVKEYAELYSQLWDART